MFTLIVQDERVYRQLMERIEQRGESLDAVLRDLLEHDIERAIIQPESSAQKLLRLIDAAELPFDHPFDARDARSSLVV
jgi:hypothetical protein